MMTGKCRGCFILMLLIALLGGGVTAWAQTTNPNERYVKPGGNVQDADASRNSKLWVLDFKFKDPRLIKVNVPGRGQRRLLVSVVSGDQPYWLAAQRSFPTSSWSRTTAT